jgi:two-component sensor histidine kinase
LHRVISHTFFFFLILLGYADYGQESNYSVYKRIYTYIDGIPGQEVVCGTQDKFGYLWFGTNNGLCRYDGSRFISFTQKLYGLRGRRILNLVTDDSLGLIITYSELGSSVKSDVNRDVINISTFQVKPIEKYYSNLPFKAEQIGSIKKRHGQKQLYFNLSSNNVWLFSSQTGFTHKIKQPLRIFEFNDFFPEKKLKINKSSLKEAESKKRNVILYNDSTIELSTLFKGVLVSEKKNEFLVCSIDSSDNTSTYHTINFSGKLTSRDSLKGIDGEFKNYNTKMLFNSSNNGASLLQEINSNYLLYLPDNGIYYILKKRDDEKIKNIHINSFFADEQGNYWLCTGEGLIQIRLKKKLFKHYFTTRQKQFSPDHSMRGIYVKHDLYCFNSYDFIGITENVDTTIIKEGKNFAISRDGDFFWIGSFLLNKLDIKTKKLEAKIHSLSKEIWSIFKLNDKQLLLGCTEGIDAYEIATNKINHISQINFPKPKFIYKIFRDSDGQIMAIAENGIYIISNNGEIVDCYSDNAITKSRNFPFKTIYDVLQDRNGDYWIGTNNDGLFKWNKKQNTFEQFNLENGFLSTTICNIQEDDFDNLWLSTQYGLVKFNKKTRLIKTYTEFDGLPNNEFNRISGFKDDKGNIYFGGIDGAIGFNPISFLTDEAEKNYPLNVNEYNLFNKSNGLFENKMSDLKDRKTIILTDDNKFFTISFSLLDFQDRHHNYAYRLEGLEKNWNYISENSVRIGNLAYGDYTLHIKAQCASGAWNKQMISIPLKVIMPFYKTSSFLIIIIVLIIALIYFFMKARFRYLNKKNEKLEITINERTSELQTSLNEQIALLQEVHHRVKNNLQFISAMLEMQINSVKNEAQQGALKETSRRISAMTLVHEMLYNKDKLEKISLNAYLKELVSKLSELINEKESLIKFEVNIDDVEYDINNCVAIGMITSELLSNSIKYAFENVAEPVITLELKYNLKLATIEYKVKDNGKGFDIKKTSSGLGLRLIDIFTRQLKGTYVIKNENGLLFTFNFTEIK